MRQNAGPYSGRVRQHRSTGCRGEIIPQPVWRGWRNANQSHLSTFLYMLIKVRDFQRRTFNVKT
jgi:hypothetical protein